MNHAVPPGSPLLCSSLRLLLAFGPSLFYFAFVASFEFTNTRTEAMAVQRFSRAVQVVLSLLLLMPISASASCNACASECGSTQRMEEQGPAGPNEARTLLDATLDLFRFWFSCTCATQVDVTAMDKSSVVAKAAEAIFDVCSSD